LTTDQPSLHHDGRIRKKKDPSPESVHEFGILTLGISEVFVITATLKKHPEEVKARFD
jgi:hypothetical protein